MHTGQGRPGVMIEAMMKRYFGGCKSNEAGWMPVE